MSDSWSLGDSCRQKEYVSLDTSESENHLRFQDLPTFFTVLGVNASLYGKAYRDIGVRRFIQRPCCWMGKKPRVSYIQATWHACPLFSTPHVTKLTIPRDIHFHFIIHDVGWWLMYTGFKVLSPTVTKKRVIRSVPSSKLTPLSYLSCRNAYSSIFTRLSISALSFSVPRRSPSNKAMRAFENS